MSRHFRAAVLLAATCVFATAAQAEPPVRFSGYYKLLGLQTHLPGGANEPYALGLNRLRLKLGYSRPAFDLQLEQDSELKLERGGSTRFDARFFRAYAKFSGERTDLTIGRQRIPLGTGRLWSALDRLNPPNPLLVEREEYVGVNALRFDYKRNALSRFLAVYSPDPAKRRDRWALRYQTHLGESDFGLTSTRSAQGLLLGIDAAAQAGDAGLRAELTTTRPDFGRSYRQVLLGVDYGFANTLTLSAECFLGHGARNCGLVAGYEITPLLKLSGVLLANLRDHSRFASPMLSYSLSDNISIGGGAQFFGGRTDSEYGAGKTTWFGQFMWFF